MALEILWSKKAENKFIILIEYLNTNFGESTTSAFIKKTFHVLELLSRFPQIGSIENEELNIRALVINKQITLFYSIKGEKIIVLNFFDNRQNPDKKY